MKLYLKESFSLLIKTYPFVLLKLIVYIALLAFFFAFAGLTLFIAFNFSGFITILIIIVGLIIFLLMLIVIRRYINYLISAGHVAVLAELVTKKELPKDKGMVSFGFDKVKSKFVTASVFFAIDAIIRQITFGVTNIISRVGSFLPNPSFKTIFQIISHIISVFLNYIDKAILSYIFVHPDENPWTGAKDGLVLYFKSWKTLLSVATVLVLLSYVLMFIVFGGIFLITLPIASQFPHFLSDYPFIIALIIAFIVKKALFDQYILVAMVVAYQETIKEISPDNETAAQLEEKVPAFKEIISNIKNN